MTKWLSLGGGNAVFLTLLCTFALLYFENKGRKQHSGLVTQEGTMATQWAVGSPYLAGVMQILQAAPTGSRIRGLRMKRLF